MRWIVVGAGSIGQRHLRTLRALGERDVVAVRRAGVPLGGDLADVAVTTDLADAVALQSAGAAGSSWRYSAGYCRSTTSTGSP